jgi:hypothetical protein
MAKLWQSLVRIFSVARSKVNGREKNFCVARKMVFVIVTMVLVVFTILSVVRSSVFVVFTMLFVAISSILALQ